MRTRIIYWVLLASSWMILVGCSSKSAFVKYDTSGINVIDIITKLENRNLKIIDIDNMRRRVWSTKDYGGKYYGLIGIAIEAAFKEVESQTLLQSNVGSGKESLNADLNNYPVKDLFDKIIFGELVQPLDSRASPSVAFFNGRLIKNNKNQDFGLNSENSDIKNTVKINFIYGIGARTKDELCAAISGDIILADSQNKTLFRDKMTTFSCSYGGEHNLADFAKDDAELYKRLFQRAASKFGRGMVYKLFY